MKKITRNKTIYLILISVLIVSGVSYYLIKTLNKADCITFLENKGKSFDTSKETWDYIKEIQKKRYIKSPYDNCSKDERLKYYLDKHPSISDVEISPTGGSISLLSKDFSLSPGDGGGYLNIITHSHEYDRLIYFLISLF